MPLEATNRPPIESESSTQYPAAIEHQSLAHRIERTQLEATIAALERELLASERRRQGVIDQYERLLASRGRGENEASNEYGDDELSETETRDRTALRRLVGLGRR